MKYRDILGFSKPKRKVIKEQPKPKKNEIIENVKKELNEWNDTSFRNAPKRWSGASDNGLTEFEQQGGKDFIKEVGAAREYRPHIKKIDKLYHDYWDAVKDFTDLLHDKGVKKEANNIHRMYMKLVHKFHKSYFVKMINKLM